MPGIAVVALGLLLLVLMIAFPERLRVPAPVGYLAAGAFVIAGLLALANVFGGRRTRAWLAVALLSCMTAPAAWIAIGPGPRSCSVAWGLHGGVAAGVACRAAFGAGAIVGPALVALALRAALRGGRPG
ncbi:MAG TPA: hypothetical protein VGF26_10930 [Ramlibacter sp.]